MTSRRDSLRASRAIVELAAAVGRPDIGRAALLSMMLKHTGETQILVVGIVKRGKSTLVNQLLGSDLSPVRALPETTGLIAYPHVRGRPRAWGVAADATPRRLSTAPWLFRRQVSRRARSRTELAVRSGRYLVAENLTLVDSVGQAEATARDGGLVSDIPVDVITLASKVLLVIGIPGVSATDMELLNSVVAIRKQDPASVLVVIKTLDSAVTLDDLRDFRSELSTAAAVPDVIRRAMLLREGNAQTLADIRTWISEPSAGGAHISRNVDWYVQLEHAVLEKAERQEAIDIREATLPLLPGSIGGLVASLLPGAIRNQLKEDLYAQHAALVDGYRAAHEHWQSGQDSLSSEMRRLEQDLSIQQKGAKSARSGGWGPGCGLLLVLPFSFAAFPIGPLIVGGVMWFWYAALSERKEAEARPYEERARAVLEQLESVRQQIVLHLEAEPLEPPISPQLAAIYRAERKERSLRYLIIGAASAAVVCCVTVLSLLLV